MKKQNIYVYMINLLALCVFLFALWTYVRRSDIVSNSMPISDFTILEKSCSGGHKGGSTVTISYLNKKYHVGITRAQCRKCKLDSLSYYYDPAFDIVFEENNLDKRQVIFFLILFLLASQWSFRVYFNIKVEKIKETDKRNLTKK